MKQVKGSSLTVNEAMTLLVTEIVQKTLFSQQEGIDKLDIKKQSRYCLVNAVSEDNNGETVLSVTDIDTSITYGVTIPYFSENSIPEIDSIILIDYDNNGLPYVSKTQDLTNYINRVRKTLELSAGETTESMSLKIVKNLLSLGDDSYGGLIKINELTTKLNGLKDEVAALKTFINSHVHPYVNVATPATTSPTTPFTGTFTAFNKGDYENTYVKHGKNIQ